MPRYSRTRGRPQGGRSYANQQVLEYLAQLAISKSLDPSKFFNALKEAWMSTESTCETMSIRCRNKTRGAPTFLFKIDQKVVGQFPVSESILQDRDPIKTYLDRLPPKAYPVKKPRVKPKIRDLAQRSKYINLKARVIETPKPHRVYTRFGTEAYVSNILLADETGTIRLSLWNQQINEVSVNDVIEIENAKVSRYKGNCQLTLGRSGKLNVREGEVFPATPRTTH